MTEKLVSSWFDGIYGVVTGDALGVPVEFCEREERDRDPVTGMCGYGTFHLPAGSWSDDSSLTLAALDSLGDGKWDLADVMDKFALWLDGGEYTPAGDTFDVGRSCCQSIRNFERHRDVHACGTRGERENGNGSLMRIMPFVLYLYRGQKRKGLPDAEVIARIHEASALTHAHARSCIACGLYYFMAREILEHRDKVWLGLPEKADHTGLQAESEAQESAVTDNAVEESGNGNIAAPTVTPQLLELLKKGLAAGFRFYDGRPEYAADLDFYRRLRDPEQFRQTDRKDIRSSGYVVDSLEAAVWCLLTTDTYRDCELKAVNLGEDTDSVAAIAGGLAGLYYTMDGIPAEWLDVILNRDLINDLCCRADGRY